MTCVANAAMSLVVLMSGCSFQVPFPPTASGRVEQESETEKKLPTDIGKYPDGYERRSPLIRRMADALRNSKEGDQTIDNSLQRDMAVEAVWRCENRLNNLVNSIRSARDARAGIGIASGSVASAGGLATALLATKSATSDKNDSGVDTATAITAAVTAVAGIFTIVSTNIGDPNTLLDIYTMSLAEYSAGKDALDTLYQKPAKGEVRTDTDRWNETVASAIEHFNLCADPSGARKASMPTPQTAVVATPATEGKPDQPPAEPPPKAP